MAKRREAGGSRGQFQGGGRGQFTSGDGAHYKMCEHLKGTEHYEFVCRTRNVIPTSTITVAKQKGEEQSGFY